MISAKVLTTIEQVKYQAHEIGLDIDYNLSGKNQVHDIGLRY